MEYLNRIVEADNKSKHIINQLSQAKAHSYNGVTSDVTFDEFNNDKTFGLQNKLEDLQTMVGYYEDAYRNIGSISGDEFTEISEYLTVDNVKEELNRRVKSLKEIIETYHYE